jgi:hypothetical protein
VLDAYLTVPEGQAEPVVATLSSLSEVFIVPPDRSGETPDFTAAMP